MKNVMTRYIEKHIVSFTFTFFTHFHTDILNFGFVITALIKRFPGCVTTTLKKFGTR